MVSPPSGSLSHRQRLFDPDSDSDPDPDKTVELANLGFSDDHIFYGKRHPMTHIAFICTANICRSPMAEGIFRHKALQAGREDLTASSMGIHGLDGEPASAYAVQVCAAHGVDISSHRARSITGEDLQQAELILCMEKGHQRFMKTYYPWHRDRAFLLGAWPDKATRKSTVKDPIGAPIQLYHLAYDVIEKHIDRIWDHL